MKTCKTCAHWQHPSEDESYHKKDMCCPVDPDTHRAMDRGFEVRICELPTQTFAEAPVERNGFGLTDASTYFACLATDEDFGCVRHKEATKEERTAQ